MFTHLLVMAGFQAHEYVQSRHSSAHASLQQAALQHYSESIDTQKLGLLERPAGLAMLQHALLL